MKCVTSHVTWRLGLLNSVDVSPFVNDLDEPCCLLFEWLSVGGFIALRTLVAYI